MILAGWLMSVGPRIPEWIGWAALALAVLILWTTRKWR